MTTTEIFMRSGIEYTISFEILILSDLEIGKRTPTITINDETYAKISTTYEKFTPSHNMTQQDAVDLMVEILFYTETSIYKRIVKKAIPYRIVVSPTDTSILSDMPVMSVGDINDFFGPNIPRTIIFINNDW